MRYSKSIITGHLIANAVLQILVVVGIALPHIEEQRLLAEKTLRLPPDTLWMPLLGILVLSTIYTLVRLRLKVAIPFQRLVNQTNLSTHSFAFKTKSMNAEEDFLKHFIESQALKFSEMEQEVQNMQDEVSKAEELSNISPEEFSHLQYKLSTTKAKLAEQLEQLAGEERKNASLESNLNLTEKALKQTSRELESLKYEVNQSNKTNQNFRVPIQTMENIKTALSNIGNLSWRLAQKWAETSPSAMRDGMEEINATTQKQLSDLKNNFVESGNSNQPQKTDV